jgi:Zn-dependent protease
MQFLTPPFVIAILLALSWHEAAHALIAYRLGDPTARDEGRLTLNPIAHLDLLGTLLFLTVGFGWGKPVPVNPRNFRNVKRDSALTALAGPISNFVLAFIAFGILVMFFPDSLAGSVEGLMQASGGLAWQSFIREVLMSSLFINLGLMAFNLLPIAPLDGSKIIHPFIPWRYEDGYERFMRQGPFILLFLLIAERALNVPFLIYWIEGIMNVALTIMSVVFRL